MVEITIAREDDRVVIDGHGADVDCSSLPDFIHAVHWSGATGQVSFRKDSRGIQAAPLAISDLGPFAFVIRAHAEAVAEIKRKTEEREARLEADKQRMEREILARETAMREARELGMKPQELKLREAEAPRVGTARIK